MSLLTATDWLWLCFSEIADLCNRCEPGTKGPDDGLRPAKEGFLRPDPGSIWWGSRSHGASDATIPIAVCDHQPRRLEKRPFVEQKLDSMRKTYYLLRPSLTIIQIITGEERGLKRVEGGGKLCCNCNIVTPGCYPGHQRWALPVPWIGRQLSSDDREEWEQSGNSFLVLVKSPVCEGDMYQPGAYLPALMAQKN